MVLTRLPGYSPPAMNPAQLETLRQTLARCEGMKLAILFGSLASGSGGPDSDLDLAVAMAGPMDASARQSLADLLADTLGRPVDLVDLSTADGTLLGQILRHGMVLHSASPGMLGRLHERFLDWQNDFAPALADLLATRRKKFLTPGHG